MAIRQFFSQKIAGFKEGWDEAASDETQKARWEVVLHGHRV